MKLTPEQLASWFYTAFPAPFPPDSEEKWLLGLSQVKGRERSSRISGMKQGINDTLTMARMMPKEARAKIDEALAQKGLPSLQKMEIGLKKKHLRILKRGRIKNDEEFYIVAEILSNLELEVTASDRCRLQEISLMYETREK